MKPPHVEEALRFLRLANRDVVAFETLRDSPQVSLASACFHAQQAVEKYFKAVLFLHRIEFRRTHDLTILTALLTANGITAPIPDKQLKELISCAVDFRYDEETEVMPNREMLTEIVSAMQDWAGGEIVG